MSALPGTAVPFVSDSDLAPVFVMGTGDTPRQREKMSPDGRATYSSGGLLLLQRGDTVSSDKSASVHVIEPLAEPLEPGQIFVSDGVVFVQPYVPNGSGRQAFSITVERLIPYGEA